jgi:hypothetical protein
MLEFIKSPDLSSKTLKKVEWELKQGEFVSENAIVCTMILEHQEKSLLSEILNTQILKPEKIKIKSPLSGVLYKINTIEEIITTKTVCAVKSLENPHNDCSHDIEYGGICVKCGEVLEK